MGSQHTARAIFDVEKDRLEVSDGRDRVLIPRADLMESNFHPREVPLVRLEHERRARRDFNLLTEMC